MGGGGGGGGGVVLASHPPPPPHAQFIIATHSPILLACPGARIFSFDHAPLQTVAYEETSHYQIYAGFMADRTRYLPSDAGSVWEPPAGRPAQDVMLTRD
jgi:hypothetical protein